MTGTELLIDQGNTRIKWVWALDGEIREASDGRGPFPAFASACTDGSNGVPDTVRVSSVAGEQALGEIAHFCRSQWGIEPRLMTSRAAQGGVKNAYPDPATLGVDRWLAIVGAAERYGKPVVIWDMGTASTLDAVDTAGRHLGGMIYPGPATMLRSLENDTRLNVPGDFEDAGLISWVGAGHSTAECILKGVLAAQVGTLNQFLRHVSLQMNRQPQLIATGGAADRILPLLDFEYIHDPWLVFRGMLID